MGQSGSKNICENDKCELSGPNITYMKVNYGEASVTQIRYWVKECGFPHTGSFSLRQLVQLREKLEEREKDKKEKVRPDWKAFSLWMEEAQRRERKSQVGTEKNSLVSQCFKMPDPDLDCAPPRRQQPRQAQHVPNAPQPELEGAVGGPLPDDNAATALPPPYLSNQENQTSKERLYPNLPASSEPSSTWSPSITRGGIQYKKRKEERIATMPMVEVTGPDGPVLVHRPWTTQDIRDAMTHLPIPNDGGQAFAAELLIFCREFRPTTSELRRLLMIKMGIGWAKVSAGWPDGDVRMTAPNWDHIDNAAFRGHITGLCNRIQEQFPVRMDMTKISSCKQEEGETASQYLVRLTTVHNTHSGLVPPVNLNGNEVGAWEAHLRNSFLNGLKVEIPDMVKRTCITWDSCKLTLLEAHAVHAEKTLREEVRKLEKHTRNLDKATLTMFQSNVRGRGWGQRRGRGRGRMRGYDRFDRFDRFEEEICYNCGKKGHWARDCREWEKGNEKTE